MGTVPRVRVHRTVPGASSEDCITSERRFWRTELGISPRRQSRSSGLALE
jgi:hypothetical protein